VYSVALDKRTWERFRRARGVVMATALTPCHLNVALRLVEISCGEMCILSARIGRDHIGAQATSVVLHQVCIWSSAISTQPSLARVAHQLTCTHHTTRLVEICFDEIHSIRADRVILSTQFDKVRRGIHEVHLAIGHLHPTISLRASLTSSPALEVGDRALVGVNPDAGPLVACSCACC
jgi:hypothetical protein